MQWARLTKELLDAEGRWISPAVHLEYLRGVADWICYAEGHDLAGFPTYNNPQGVRGRSAQGEPMTSVFHVTNYSHPCGPVHPPTQLCQHPQTNPDFVREPLCSPAESTASLGGTKASLC